MKKKLLSLMMAAAMVATTSVGAFATTTVTGPDDQEHTTDINITGDIADNNGDFKPGTLQVTVPTAANFQVDNTGKFTGANITINNNGTSSVDILAYKFVDTNGAQGIEVKKRSDITTTPDSVGRNAIALSLRGNQGTAYFSSDINTTGVFKEEELSNQVKDGKKISTIAPGDDDTLNLEGEAGTQQGSVPQAIQDRFTLTLKIVKTPNPAPAP